jgi:hypothetical protein
MSETKLAGIKPTYQTATIDLARAAPADGVAHACAPAAESPLEQLYPQSLFTAKATASYRLAMHFRLSRSGIGRGFVEAPTNNGRLIFCSRDVAGEPRNIGVAVRGRLNAFFAISVNSPVVSMVNSSCCVCSALNSCARGVTRRATPQPMCAAVRMEAGAHACL